MPLDLHEIIIKTHIIYYYVLLWGVWGVLKNVNFVEKLRQSVAH